MKKLSSRGLVIGSVCAAVALLGFKNSKAASSQEKLQRLLVGGVQERHGDNLAQDPARKQRAWRLYRFWLARNNGNVVPKIAPYLNDEYWRMRESAARILGRLESPQSERPLQAALLRSQQRKATNYIDPLVIKLALARVRARNLQGQKKITAIVEGAGLSYGEAVQLSAKVVAAWSGANGSPGETISRELVDVFYCMRKQGQNTSSIVKQFTFYPAQRVQLQVASLPANKEAEFIVRYLAHLNVLTPNDLALAETHLPTLKASAANALIRGLEGVINFGGGQRHERA